MICGYGRYVSGKVSCVRAGSPSAPCIARDRTEQEESCSTCGAHAAWLLRDLVRAATERPRIGPDLAAKVALAFSRMPDRIEDAAWLEHLSAEELDYLRSLGDEQEVW